MGLILNVSLCLYRFLTYKHLVQICILYGQVECRFDLKGVYFPFWYRSPVHNTNYSTVNILEESWRIRDYINILS